MDLCLSLGYGTEHLQGQSLDTGLQVGFQKHLFDAAPAAMDMGMHVVVSVNLVMHVFMGMYVCFDITMLMGVLIRMRRNLMFQEHIKIADQQSALHHFFNLYIIAVHRQLRKLRPQVLLGRAQIQQGCHGHIAADAGAALQI